MTTVIVFKPEIVELLAQVEQRFGKSLNTPTDFYDLSLRLQQLKQAVSMATL